MRLVAGGAPGECGVLVQRLQQQVEDAQPEGCGGGCRAGVLWRPPTGQLKFPPRSGASEAVIPSSVG
jgi:hypothetical protein